MEKYANADWDVRAQEWYGWMKSSASRCPRVLAGKRHRSERCICTSQRYYHSFLDHSARWKLADGTHFLTSEPYGDFTDTSDDKASWRSWLIEFGQELAELGLSLEIFPPDMSPYYPGSTSLFVIQLSDKFTQYVQMLSNSER